eukprot:CAMPEP_0197589798 /NCGR_PEP_ID=MMETSP1326-20131121/10615_1 /TAXON_ID=1155430 /ORGANISM="Genus nov. species nov., Strain RCC2288" /LENGTH=92 /DNA_ID=CAMNT_0043154775 /DNA_START=47 /DNA_END=322 /DNA_ORIENTATION=-
MQAARQGARVARDARHEGDDGDGDGEYSDDEAHKGHGSRRVPTFMQRAAVVVALLLAAAFADELGELLNTMRKPLTHLKKHAMGAVTAPKQF